MTGAEIRQYVEDELGYDPSLEGAGIEVAVNGGVVTLTGHVPTFAELQAAERAAIRVRGVKAVVNKLEVRLPGQCQRSDQDVAGDAVTALERVIPAPADRVKVEVSNGWVTLEGEVGWRFQKEAAERSIRDIAGIRGVTNRIQVMPARPPESIRERIEAALERSGMLEPSRIRVETRGDHAVLRGVVGSWAEREEAERIAWSAGVCHVDNNLSIEKHPPQETSNP